MLVEYKQMFAEHANAIPNWKNIDKNELVRIYCKLKDENDPMADNYLSAVIYKFWYMLTTNYHNQLLKIAPEEDAYNWLIDAIMYSIDHRAWDNPDNRLYNDPKGPEKSISVALNSLKTNYFVSLTRDKRSVNKYIYALDDTGESISEYIDEGNDFVIHAQDISQYVITDIIDTNWKLLDYLTCFILDSIVNIEICQKDKEALLRHLRKLDDDYLRGFAETYHYSLDQVMLGRDYVLDPRYHDPKEFPREVNTKIFLLSKDPRILSITEDYRKGR